MKRQYIIFNISEMYKIDFDLIYETSAETLRKSIDGTKSIIKWDGEQPAFINSLETIEGPYSNDEILEILSTDEWTSKEIN